MKKVMKKATPMHPHAKQAQADFQQKWADQQSAGLPVYATEKGQPTSGRG